MTTFAILLVVVSAILHAIRDFLTKKSGDKQLFVWWFSVVSMGFTLPIIIYLIATEGLPNATGVIIALSMGTVHFLYWLFYSKAYEKGDLSHVYPIMRSAPALVLIFATIFLHEKTSTIGIIGIITITFGVYIINLKGFHPRALLEPMIAVFHERHVQFAFLTMITVAVYSIIDKIGVTYINPFMYGFLICLSASTFFSIYLFKTKRIGGLLKTWKENKKVILINGFFASINYPLILIAFTLSNVSYVVGLRQISIIIAALLGGHMLKEGHRTLRLFSAIIICTGAILVAIA